MDGKTEALFLDAGGPEWDISSEYRSFEDPAFIEDIGMLKDGIKALSECSNDIAACIPGCGNLNPASEKDLLSRCEECFRLMDGVVILHSNLATWVNCRLSIDGGDGVARRFDAEMDSLAAELGQAADPVRMLTTLCSEDFLAALLRANGVKPHAFGIAQARLRRERMLPLEVEAVIKQLGVNGFAAWGSLYGSISSTTECRVATAGGERRMGIAQAAGLLRKPDRALREAAWRGINAAYASHDEALASILNALAGWRHSENRQRSRTETVHFLDEPLDRNNVSKATIEAMFRAVDGASDIGRRALKAQAKACGVSKLAPWDLLAPAPETRSNKDVSAIPFAKGIALVQDAFSRIAPEMGEFVNIMRENRWIEGRSLGTKRPGAYCTEFLKSRTPRVYATYQGSLDDVGTLAHELGHAFHGWTMRGLHHAETYYPMTLAETASTFAEAALASHLVGEAGGLTAGGLTAGGSTAGGSAADEATRFAISWSHAQDAATFLLNIPARFDFERSFYELRLERTVQAEGLAELMEASWRKYYGDALSEYDGGFWKSKLHFYKTGISFYNFPYTFGYLFSMGVFARREAEGAGFFESYRSMLMDTGRLTVEELAKRHLGVDLSRPEFWEAGIQIVRGNVEKFEKMV